MKRELAKFYANGMLELDCQKEINKIFTERFVNARSHPTGKIDDARNATFRRPSGSR